MNKDAANADNATIHNAGNKKSNDSTTNKDAANANNATIHGTENASGHQDQAQAKEDDGFLSDGSGGNPWDDEEEGRKTDDKPGNSEQSKRNDEPSKKRTAPWDDGRVDSKRSRQGMGMSDQEEYPCDVSRLPYKVTEGSRALLRNTGRSISKYKMVLEVCHP